MVIGTIAQVWRYPVKSMAGERLASVDLDERGVPGDRQWATRDHVRGGIRGAKQLGGLMGLAARTADDGTVVITLPDGREVRADAPDTSAALSEALDHPVTLEALRPATDLDHYRRGAPEHDDLLDELRAVFALEPDDPLPDLGIFPPEIMEFESPPGTYVDAFPLLVLTDASLRSLQALAPQSVIDVRRFRPSLLVHTDGDGFPEQAWIGHRLQVGDAVLQILAGCPRCVMVTRGFADLPADRSIMRTLVRETNQLLGVYARVLEPGPVAEGDDVELGQPTSAP